jgi:hypothetical protein
MTFGDVTCVRHFRREWNWKWVGHDLLDNRCCWILNVWLFSGGNNNTRISVESIMATVDAFPRKLKRLKCADGA